MTLEMKLREKREAGFKEGFLVGYEEGFLIGYEEGLVLGQEKGRADTIAALSKAMNMSKEDIEKMIDSSL